MVGRNYRFLVRLLRQFAVLLLVLGIACLGVAGAGQMSCLPGCDMHQEVVVTPPCCEGGDMDHAAMVPAETGIPSSPSSSPCCQGKLCFDSPVDSPEVAAAVGGCETAAAPPPLLVLSDESGPPLSLHNFPSDPPPAGSPIPIYLRTCTFLI